MIQKTLFAALLLGIGTAAMADSTPRIDRMQAHQATRIEHGVATGALTGPETRRLAHQQRQLARHEARVEADGQVTRGERYRLNRDAARTSHSIRRQAHDGQTRH